MIFNEEIDVKGSYSIYIHDRETNELKHKRENIGNSVTNVFMHNLLKTPLNDTTIENIANYFYRAMLLERTVADIGPCNSFIIGNGDTLYGCYSHHGGENLTSSPINFRDIVVNITTENNICKTVIDVNFVFLRKATGKFKGLIIYLKDPSDLQPVGRVAKEFSTKPYNDMTSENQDVHAVSRIVSYADIVDGAGEPDGIVLNDEDYVVLKYRLTFTRNIGNTVKQNFEFDGKNYEVTLHNYNLSTKPNSNEYEGAVVTPLPHHRFEMNRVVGDNNVWVYNFLKTYTRADYRLDDVVVAGNSYEDIDDHSFYQTTNLTSLNKITAFNWGTKFGMTDIVNDTHLYTFNPFFAWERHQNFTMKLKRKVQIKDY